MRISVKAALVLTLSVMGTMHAGQIRTINLSGSFVTSGSGVPTLEGGSFSGSYTVDVDLLPVAPSVTLQLLAWNVQVMNSSGTVLQTFVNGAVTQSGILQGQMNSVQSDALNFQDSLTNNRLTLAFFQGFDGQGQVVPSITTNFITLNSEFQMGNGLSLIGVTSGSAAAAAAVGTPEPGTVTLLGAAAMLLAGVKLRGTQKA
jgi:hypothetical protein